MKILNVQTSSSPQSPDITRVMVEVFNAPLEINVRYAVELGEAALKAAAEHFVNEHKEEIISKIDYKDIALQVGTIISKEIAKKALEEKVL